VHHPWRGEIRAPGSSPDCTTEEARGITAKERFSRTESSRISSLCKGIKAHASLRCSRRRCYHARLRGGRHHIWRGKRPTLFSVCGPNLSAVYLSSQSRGDARARGRAGGAKAAPRDVQQLGGAAYDEEDRQRTLSAHRGPPSLAATIGGARAWRIRRMAHLLRAARTKDAPDAMGEARRGQREGT
jgi:hypothetical protein